MEAVVRRAFEQERLLVVGPLVEVVSELVVDGGVSNSVMAQLPRD